ncbi:hypothetical protein Tco_1248562, partial [Tanacetum coccineum]
EDDVSKFVVIEEEVWTEGSVVEDDGGGEVVMMGVGWRRWLVGWNLGCTETPLRCRMTFSKRGETGKRGETPGKRPQEKGKRF